MTGVVVDSSAVVAIVRAEEGTDWLVETLLQHDERVIPAPILLECGIVLESRVRDADRLAEDAIRRFAITVAPCDESLALRAMAAWRRFGKGRHPAALNFGDCFTYALAERRAEPVLCVGEDFAQTDLAVLRPTP